MDKIICLGINYSEHAKELGATLPEYPVVFFKPPSVLVQVQEGGGLLELPFPHGRGRVHPECEVVFLLGEKTIEAFTLGLDMTLRDKQLELKKNAHPWTVSKVFANSAIVGPWVDFSKFAEFSGKPFSFRVEKEVAQQGLCKNMRLSPPECVQYVSQFFPLYAGDLLFSGTPGRVQSIQPEKTCHLLWGSLSFSLRWV